MLLVLFRGCPLGFRDPEREPSHDISHGSSRPNPPARNLFLSPPACVLFLSTLAPFSIHTPRILPSGSVIGRLPGPELG